MSAIADSTEITEQTETHLPMYSIYDGLFNLNPIPDNILNLIHVFDGALPGDKNAAALQVCSALRTLRAESLETDQLTIDAFINTAEQCCLTETSEPVSHPAMVATPLTVTRAREYPRKWGETYRVETPGSEETGDTNTHVLKQCWGERESMDVVRS